MSRQGLIALALALGIGLAPSLAAAQARPPEPEQKRAAEAQSRAVKGWPGGIVFTCVVAPVALETPAIKSICQHAEQTAKAQAGAAKLKFAAAADSQTFLRTIARDVGLGLMVVISPSDFSLPLASLVVHVKASREYSDLVSAAARGAANAAQNPLAQPRVGEVVFWEEFVVGSGPPAQLAPAMLPQVDDKLRQFFAQYH